MEQDIIRHKLTVGRYKIKVDITVLWPYVNTPYPIEIENSDKQYKGAVLQSVEVVQPEYRRLFNNQYLVNLIQPELDSILDRYFDMLMY